MKDFREDVCDTPADISLLHLPFAMILLGISMVYDGVFISTNCKEIFDWYNVHIKNNPLEHIRENIFLIERPEDLCGDDSSTESAMVNLFSTLLSKGIEVESFVLLQPTSPFRTDDIVHKCLQAYYDNKELYTVFSASKNTPFNWKNKNGIFYPHYDFSNRKMRQKLGEDEFNWHEDGNVYVFSSHNLIVNNNRMTENAIAIENNTINSIQIDNYEEMDIARSMCNIEKVNLWMKTIVF